jgi:vanillate O-demethylase monooxygenase subunit
MFGHYGEPVDHWLNMRWDPPAHMMLDVGITYPGEDRSKGIWTLNMDIITPETQTTSHYFWSVSRAYALGDAHVSQQWEAAIDGAFGGQDKPMLEAVQRMMGDASFDSLRPLLIKPDVGAVRCRRVIQKLLAAEAGASAAAEVAVACDGHE